MSNHSFQQENPPLILAVDTASTCAGLALARGENILASIKTDLPIPHSKTFFNLLSSLLQTAQVSLPEVDGFAAATGPGSFTGLRVGLSAVKGLSHALGKPAIGINSLDALALASKADGKILVALNAGREEAYAGLRRIGAEGIPEIISQDMVAPASIVGSQFEPFLQEDSVVKLMYGFNEEAVPSTAVEIAVCAAKILMLGRSFDLRPHYIRPSDAEIKKL